ncbi:DNA replication/repair protein RecF [Serpentinicella sp. ANB-PHB4]|uniref:DNA replication/repair protein RecF n=1 Tax=Serpentinicella sp. ANB-PHB4 TaxID=3074076 RepID=UPI00285ABA60|nr:DNA replication/repair protein RecF [Serpentinicella sp. ANB-PHB4]MDR5658915.1 DNA replication/repair protein RecF [Serpentinicella sp. ANB-PHB4]
MRVQEVRIINYRNYEDILLEFHPKINLFIGENAQGKTNLLESIYLCGLGKSFRNNKDQELINIDKNQAYIRTNVKKKDRNVKIELKLQKEKKKQVKVNGIITTKYSELLGNLNIVLFSPEDLKIVKEGPSERRRFIDNDISQIFPKYHYLTAQYNKVLQQRNKLLKSRHTSQVDLEVWNEQLSSYGSEIIIYRKQFIKKLSILAKLMHRRITQEKENLSIKYESNVKINGLEDKNDIKINFLENLKSRYKDERYRGVTLVGPHRDDIKFFINNMEVKRFGSQGQQRTTVLSLKLSELELIKGEVGEYPILLLDDVMSELDESRQKYLLMHLKNIQTFITTTNVEQCHLKEDDIYETFKIIKGKVYRK